MAAAAMLDFSCNFRFLYFSFRDAVMYPWLKFRQNRLINDRVIALLKNPRWPPPPS
jgi:hypothetical protein